MRRFPHGYFDNAVIVLDLAAAGLAAPCIDTVAARSHAVTALEPAIAFCQGTPLRSEIEARASGELPEATSRCAEAIKRRFGAGPVDGKIQAHVVRVCS
jgi:hypothetical protein